MRYIVQALSWLHAFSLDIAISAMALAWPLYQSVPLGPIWIVLLGLSVHWIYLSDHVMDVISQDVQNWNLRHAFVKTHVKKIRLYLVVVPLVQIILLFYFDLFQETWIVHIQMLLACLLAYFALSLSKKSWPRELFTAGMYTAGICFIPWSVKPIYGETILLFLNTLLNLIQNSLEEQNEESFNHQPSILHGLKSIYRKRLYVFSIVFTIIFPAIFYQIFSQTIRIEFILWTILNPLAHVFLFRLKRKNKISETAYRSGCEWLFALPGIIYLVLAFFNN